MASISPQLEDFWKTLWHVDVAKDHKDSYSTDIVNSFLPNNGLYTTDQTTTDRKSISSSGKQANRTGGGNAVLSFHDLFTYLTGEDIAALFSAAVGKEGVVELRPELVGPGNTYYIKVIAENDGITLSQIITEQVCLFVDTASHLPTLMGSYYSVGPRANPLYYAYTREIESDPADKMTFKTLKDEGVPQLFYFEQPAPANPTIVPFPKYTPTDGMSYFYCKYPVFLRNDGVKSTKTYKLKVQLSYIGAENKQIVVSEGANIAGAINKFKDGLKRTFGFSSDNTLKEIVFISKHHGDVAQTLTKFRDITLKCPVAGEIKSSLFSPAFVSIDVNAIIKALTVGVPYILMYTPDKKRIIVWKKQVPDTAEMRELRLVLEKQRVRELFDKLKTLIDASNKSIDNGLVPELLARFQTAMDQALAPLPIPVVQLPLMAFAEQYRNVVRQGIQIAVLLSLLPKPNEIKRIELPPELLVDFITPINSIEVALRFQTIMKDKLKELSIPIEQLQVLPGRLFQIDAEGNERLAEVDLENDLIFDFVKTGVQKILDMNSVRFTDTLSTINLRFDMGDSNLIETLTCRVGTKLNVCWGIDIIYFCWLRIRDFNQGTANSFIEKLRNIIRYAPSEIGKPSKLRTFDFGLSLVGINPISELENIVQLGGGIERKRVRYIHNDNNISIVSGSPIKKLVSPTSSTTESLNEKMSTNQETSSSNEFITPTAASIRRAAAEKIFLNSLIDVLNDMINQCRFVLNLIYLEKFGDKMSNNTFTNLGFTALNKFVKKTFGSDFTTEGITSKKQKKLNPKRKIIRGGADEDFIQLVQTALSSHMVLDDTRLLPVNTFDMAGFTLKNNFNATFSFLECYEQIAENLTSQFNKLQERIGRLQTLRPTDERLQKIQIAWLKVQELQVIIYEINNADSPVWFPDGNLTASGGKRFRSYRTFRKSKNPKRKTLKNRTYRKKSRKP